MDPEKKELNAEMDASRDRFRVGARFKGPVGTYMGSHTLKSMDAIISAISNDYCCLRCRCPNGPCIQ
ncbi:hypothetical protein PF005_g14813 [Phytophthora fragariae]|uniref:Uncharacterized protein n=1 Tax=Phytophthora fragariae TaxID=53985 RepID=A0A6A3XPH4_9STRA|nr:hypothetical protein PF005_g14813 [Phytophthora fragariae]